MNLNFLIQNIRLLSFGIIMAFTSSFGQTFFISLFGPSIQLEFGLSHTSWGAVYLIGTLGSALVLTYSGSLIDYYKLNTTTIEFKILLPFLYIINIISLFGIIFFIQKTQSIYLLPIFFKIIADYWICTIFFNQINEEFSILDFIVLSLIHPVYVVSLGIISPFINFNWKNNV